MIDFQSTPPQVLIAGTFAALLESKSKHGLKMQPSNRSTKSRSKYETGDFIYQNERSHLPYRQHRLQRRFKALNSRGARASTFVRRSLEQIWHGTWVLVREQGLPGEIEIDC